MTLKTRTRNIMMILLSKCMTRPWTKFMKLMKFTQKMLPK